MLLFLFFFNKKKLKFDFDRSHLIFGYFLSRVRNTTVVIYVFDTSRASPDVMFSLSRPRNRETSHLKKKAVYSLHGESQSSRLLFLNVKEMTEVLSLDEEKQRERERDRHAVQGEMSLGYLNIFHAGRLPSDFLVVHQKGTLKKNYQSTLNISRETKYSNSLIESV